MEPCPQCNTMCHVTTGTIYHYAAIQAEVPFGIVVGDPRDARDVYSCTECGIQWPAGWPEEWWLAKAVTHHPRSSYATVAISRRRRRSAS